MAVEKNKLRDQKKKENEAELMSGRVDEKSKLRYQRETKMNLIRMGCGEEEAYISEEKRRWTLVYVLLIQYFDIECYFIDLY